MAGPTASFPIVYLKKLRFCRENNHYIQVNRIVEKPKIVNAEAKENPKKAEFFFMSDLNFLIFKSSIDPKLLQLKIYLPNNQKGRAFEKFSTVVTELTKQFSLLFVGEEIVKPEELEEQVVDALHVGHPDSIKMLADSHKFNGPGCERT